MPPDPGGGKALEPGPDPGGVLRSGQGGAGAVQGRADRLIGLLVRHVQAVGPRRVVGGVDHGADEIRCLGHIRVALAQLPGVHGAVNDRAEHVRRQPHPRRVKLFPGVSQKAGDHGLTVLLWQAGNGGIAHVIKLDLVKARLDGELGDFKQIIPHLLGGGVHPGDAAPLADGLSVRRTQGQLRPGLGQHRVFKRHDTGNGINLLLFQGGHQSGQVLDVPGPGPQPGGLAGLRHEAQPALVVLHVDDHGVQLSFLHQGGQVLHMAAPRHRAGHIDAPDRGRLSLRTGVRLRLRHVRTRRGYGLLGGHRRDGGLTVGKLRLLTGQQQDQQANDQGRCRRDDGQKWKSSAPSVSGHDTIIRLFFV